MRRLTRPGGTPAAPGAPSPASAPVVVRHDLGRTAAVVVWIVGVGAVAAGWPVGVSEALAAIGAAGLAWGLGWWPAVIVDDAGVTVRNPSRDVRIGWAALDDAGFDWSLWLRSADLTCRAAAAPGPASMGALYDRRSSGGVIERRTVSGAGRIPPPALAVVRQRWATRRHVGSTDVVVARSWTVVAVIVASLAALVATAVAG